MLSCSQNTKISCFSKQRQNTWMKIPSKKTGLDNQLCFALMMHTTVRGQISKQRLQTAAAHRTGFMAQDNGLSERSDNLVHSS